MFSALWDIFSSLVSAFFQVVGALGRGLLDVLSALASAVLWPSGPLRGSCSATGTFPPSGRPCTFRPAACCWPPLILFFLWALWSNHKRKKGD